MEFYETIEKRHTIRDFAEKPVPEDVLKRILAAGLKAPSHDHARNWHFVVIRDVTRITKILAKVSEGAAEQMDFIKQWTTASESQTAMYLHALPRQVKMLMQSRCLVLPLFLAGADLMQPKGITSLNSFASIWCVLENILLAATAEGLGCALRISINEEENYVLKQIDAPAAYRMPCYLALGYADTNASVIHQTPCPLEDRIHRDRW